MTKLLRLRDRPSAGRLLARILETPNLAEEVRALAPPVLARVIDQVGLEDAGELLAFATTAQLAGVFDEDLWRARAPGQDEDFDGPRFLVWLEVMLEAGDAFVAEKLAELPADLVTHAFHQQVLVVHFDDLAAAIEDEGVTSPTGKAFASCLTEELDEYQVISRRHEGWDSVLAALLALDRDHHDVLVRLLERCRHMCAGQIDDHGGLYEVLTSEEMLAVDVAADREDRRAEAGHVAPSAARAFLKLARQPVDARAAERDPMTRAYFRQLAKPSAPAAPPAGPQPTKLLRVLRDAGALEPGLPLLLGSGGGEAGDEPLLARAMRRLAEEAPAVFATRSEEIAYLANVLAAGSDDLGGRLRQVDALREAIRACSEGLEAVTSATRAHEHLDAAVDALRRHPADVLFRVAWSRRG